VERKEKEKEKEKEKMTMIKTNKTFNQTLFGLFKQNPQFEQKNDSTK